MSVLTGMAGHAREDSLDLNGHAGFSSAVADRRSIAVNERLVWSYQVSTCCEQAVHPHLLGVWPLEWCEGLWVGVAMDSLIKSHLLQICRLPFNSLLEYMDVLNEGSVSTKWMIAYISWLGVET
jgi:hypothetical protein